MSDVKQTVEPVRHNLQLDEQIPFQQKGWLIQKIGWTFILLVMTAGILGVFGSGVLSKRSVTSGMVTAQFERMFRYETEMKVALQAQEHIGTISLPQQYIKGFRIVRFVPQPLNNHTENGQVVYNFPPAQNRILTLYMIPKSYGSISGTMRINARHLIPLDHFIFP